MTSVKICGITDKANLIAAIEAGADFIGLVFYPPSKRHIDQSDARILLNSIPKNLLNAVTIVGLFVNPTDADLLVSDMLDIIQLHGDESPKRCIEIKQNTDCAIMKAIPIKTPQDLTHISAYEPICDWLLFDAKPSDAVHDIPGGNGLSFDWTLLKGQKFNKPYMLAGGLTSENVGTAINLLQPDAVDVSSGVESSQGIKDAQKIKRFISKSKTTN
jgi:phosphoribosylanthranilate isomerase